MGFPSFLQNIIIQTEGKIPIPEIRYKKILISPLDWGLGHATRIVPLIRVFEHLGCRVSIACSGATERLLRAEFPEAEFIPLKGYGVGYPRNGRLFLFSILRQIPGILFSVWREHRWLSRQQRIHRWDAVVSDNRYGLYHRYVPSVLITHQLHIRTGVSNLLDALVRFLLFRRLRRFDECWVPDSKEEPTLSGALSHGNVPDHVRYVGPLSRLHAFPGEATGGRVLVLLSGPEPQRTIFEGMIEAGLKGLRHDVTIVRGLPGEATAKPDSEGVRWVNHLVSEELETALSSASLVVARSGYSTVMDLVRMRRRAVLVPTPGQTEQEYLARHLTEAGWFHARPQSGFDLRRAVEEGLSFPASCADMDFELHGERVLAFLSGDHNWKSRDNR